VKLQHSLFLGIVNNDTIDLPLLWVVDTTLDAALLWSEVWVSKSNGGRQTDELIRDVKKVRVLTLG
jgi:hypothetical protein